MARSIGADQVIDYTKEDFTQNGQRYDLILAANGYHPISDYRRALSPNGIYVMTGGSDAAIDPGDAPGTMDFNNREPKNGLTWSSKPNKKDLVFMKELIEAGKVKPVIDRCYPLNEVAEASAILERTCQGQSRHHCGEIPTKPDQSLHMPS